MEEDIAYKRLLMNDKQTLCRLIRLHFKQNNGQSFFLWREGVIMQKYFPLVLNFGGILF